MSPNSSCKDSKSIYSTYRTLTISTNQLLVESFHLQPTDNQLSRQERQSTTEKLQLTKRLVTNTTGVTKSLHAFQMCPPSEVQLSWIAFSVGDELLVLETLGTVAGIISLIKVEESFHSIHTAISYQTFAMETSSLFPHVPPFPLHGLCLTTLLFSWLEHVTLLLPAACSKNACKVKVSNATFVLCSFPRQRVVLSEICVRRGSIRSLD